MISKAYGYWYAHVGPQLPVTHGKGRTLKDHYREDYAQYLWPIADLEGTSKSWISAKATLFTTPAGFLGIGPGMPEVGTIVALTPNCGYPILVQQHGAA